jgi:hypothetical protein
MRKSLIRINHLILFSSIVLLPLVSCVDGDYYELYDEEDYLNESVITRKKKQNDIMPGDSYCTWQNGECATWALLYFYNSSHLNSQDWKNEVINALCGNNPSTRVDAVTLSHYNAAIQTPSCPGGFSKSAIISAGSRLSMSFHDSSISLLGIDRYRKNKRLSGVIMSTGDHVVIANKYLKKNDEFNIVDIFTYMGYDSNLQNQNPDNGGLSNSRTISASSVVWIISL